MFDCVEVEGEVALPYAELIGYLADGDEIAVWREEFASSRLLPTGEWLVSWRGREYVLGIDLDGETGLINYFWERQEEGFSRHEWARLRPLDEGRTLVLLVSPSYGDPEGTRSRLEAELARLRELVEH